MISLKLIKTGKIQRCRKNFNTFLSSSSVPKIILLASIMGMFLLGAFSAHAQNFYYVRAGATGAQNGSDWANAYTSLPATLVRGATYYLADGNYGSYTLGDAVSGSLFITIKKATVSDHGSETGWNNAYGDGEAIFSGLNFSTGYYIIDGQRGGGPDSWDSGFGFKITNTSGKRIVFQANVSHVSISHTEITNTNNTPDNGASAGSLVYAYSNVTFVTFSYCKLHHVYGCCIQTGYSGADNWTIEYSKLGDNTGDSYHSEIWSALGNDNLTVRYCWLYKWRSTGGLVAINGAEGQFGDSEVCENWKIYGNVFHQDGTTASWVIAAIDDSSNQQIARNWTVVNNIFVDLNSTSTWVLLKVSTSGTANNILKNNIFWTTDSVELAGWTDENYNYYKSGLNGQFFRGANDKVLSSDPFNASSGMDFSLAAPLPGAAISSEYSIDMNGINRGTDGVWDCGAFEFGGTIEISPPKSLRVM